MKTAFLVLIAILLALLAAALAPVFKADPGMVQIHFLGWTLETSVLVLVLGVLLVWVLVWAVIRLWKMPVEAARKVREQRSLVQLEKGLLALTEGDWQTAERALQKSASSHGRTTARYLAAAEAADGQDAGDRAEYYLEQADTRNKKQKFLVELTRARILMSNEQFEEARPILEDLQARRRKHPQVLEMLSRCYTEMGEWEPLVKLLPVMLKANMLDTKKAAALKQQAAIIELQHSKTADSLQADWRALPKNMQRDVAVVHAFAERAIELDEPGITEDVIRTTLKREWDPSLVVPYGVPGLDDTSKRLRQCEKWLQTHPEDPWLHLTLGRLCAREELWGKAREHLVRSLEIEPTVAGYDSLGQLLERKGELEVAMACFRNALRMNQGKDPEPLPGELARLEAPLKQEETGAA
ncbi:MAG: heme biosynthesis HemY N-terminal domain-containing protein [Xanthomonadales bacterium]|jgi:HemY protein|nr:heme biosynthesis HemY N-terminal domain-containing protein [Xanthomonadales bacterium]